MTGLSCVGIAERRGQPLRRLKRWLLTEELPRARKLLRACRGEPFTLDPKPNATLDRPLSGFRRCPAGPVGHGGPAWRPDRTVWSLVLARASTCILRAAPIAFLACYWHSSQLSRCACGVAGYLFAQYWTPTPPYVPCYLDFVGCSYSHLRVVPTSDHDPCSISGCRTRRCGEHGGS